MAKSDEHKGRRSDRGQSANGRAGEAYVDLRERAGEAALAIEANPAAALLGGIALGAVVGALLPRSRREADALRPIGARAAAAARAAVDAARTNGIESLTAAGFGGDAVRAQASRLMKEVGKAAASAGGAAASAARDARTGR